MADLRVIDAEERGKGVIKVLEAALKEARRGDLSSVAVAKVLRDGCADWAWSDAPNNSTLIGAIARLQFALIDEANA